ncbi:MAG: copper chaperone PCu(A)C [Robiginitomaculum sp.]|nr:copper chaperone PCu(A)C [Robiginitomaculum sp.]
MIRFIIKIFLAGALLIIVSCSESVLTSPDITVSEAWVRMPPKGRDIAAGYLVLNNSGSKDTLLSVSSPIAHTVEVHQHLMADGMMQMQEVSELAIPANGEVVFKSGGYHLMMFGVTDVELGQEAELVFVFEKSGTKTVTATIRSQVK